MKRILVRVLIFISVPVCAEEKLRFGSWTEGDIIREFIWGTLHVCDWGQTLYAADNPKRFIERNPILGDHPSRGKVNAYMGTWLVAHPIITNYLPREVVWLDTKIPLRAIFQSLSIGISGYSVIHNFSAGVHMSF